MTKMKILFLLLAMTGLLFAAPQKSWDAIFGEEGQGEYLSAKIEGNIRFMKYQHYGEKQPLAFKVKSDNFDFTVSGEIQVSSDKVEKGFYGVCNQTKEVWISCFNKPKLFDDEELIELVEEEVREVLVSYGFPEETPIIKGSAFKALSEPDNPEATACIDELLSVMDSYFKDPDRAADLPFLMPIEDVFTISGRGTVVTGRIERGIIKLNEEVEIVGIRPTQKTVITGIEMFNKLLDQGEAGDNVGLLLRGIDKKSVERGQVLAKPGSINPHTKFEGEVYVLSKEEGGRHSPFFSGYRPQFYFRTTDITGTITLPEGVDMVKPGDNTKVIGELIHPVAMDKGLKFAIREGGRTIASGQVTEVLS